jgi:ATP-dependent exoDNAse (exonuclease V) beta subunit
MIGDTFISASAGTGKTYRLVKEYTDILGGDPSLDLDNVLAITFTEKAAKEMKERVSRKIAEKLQEAATDDERARWKRLGDRIMDAWISTIHSFCDRLLRESLLYTDYGIDPGFSIITGTKKLIENRTLRRYCMKNLGKLESLADALGLDATHGLLEEALGKERHNLYIYGPAEADSRDDRAAQESARLTADFFEAFGQINGQYEEATLKNGQLDFEQLLELTRRMLNDHPEIAKEYARRFRYILVDEFQDTDELQAEIIGKIREAGDVKVLYVGDDKQSIYRFRGANVEVFNDTEADFRRRGKTTETLDTSYRSHPDIVKFHNIFFGKVMGRERGPGYASTYVKDITAVKDYGGGRERVRILESADKEYSATVADYIGVLLEEELEFNLGKREEKRNVRPGDIAILLRKFTNVRKYEQALEDAGIPYYTVGSRKFFESPEIAGLLSLAGFIGNPDDDLAFLAFFLSPAWGGTLEEALRLKGGSNHFSEALSCAGEGEFSDLKATLDRYSRLSMVTTPGELIESFVEETDYLSKVSLLKAPAQRVANVIKFLQISKELDALGTSLREFSKNVAIYVEESQEGEASLENEKSDSVKIMTVHQSKGLEFPVVIVAEMTEYTKKDRPGLLFDSQSRKFAVYCEKVGDARLEEWRKLEERKQAEEEKRTLYVALTRAREVLVMNVDGGIVERKKARRGDEESSNWTHFYIDGLFDAETGGMDESLGRLVKKVSAGKREKGGAREVGKRLSWEEPPAEYLSPTGHRKFVKRVSPTTMQPGARAEKRLSFETEEGEETAANVRGIYVHAILEKLDNTRDGRLSSILEGAAARTAAEVPEEEAGSIITSLRTLADHPLIREIEDSQACYSERTFERAFDGFTLRGVVDKLYRTPEGWKIADFKYAEKRADSLEGYRFQMEFYLYLLEKMLAPVCAKILFLKDGQTETVTLEDTREFEERLGALLERGG